MNPHPTAAAVLCSALCLAIGFRGLFADTVVLKDGRRFENVRTRLGRRVVEVQTEDGRRLNFPVRSMQSLRYAPVQWAPGAVDNQTASPSVREADRQSGSNDVSETASAPTIGSSEPAVVPGACRSEFPFLEGLIPIWTPHYCAGRPYWGLFFSASESLLLWQALLWRNAPVLQNDDFGYTVTGLAGANALPSGTGERFVFLYYWFDQGARTVRHPLSSKGYLSEADYRKRRNASLGLLLSALLLDGYLAWLWQPDSAAGNDASSAATVDLQLLPIGRDQSLSFALRWRF